jgi:hypothetical protein
MFAEWDKNNKNKNAENDMLFTGKYTHKYLKDC